ncbi:MAG: hypothetical protein NG737_00465 [Omnitrophica bacterium]|nr:hypothetical protein [Candidatus Omnitrophota bacterium]
MAEERDITPEKQLLRLIEDPKLQNKGALQAQKVKHRGLSLLSPAAWISRFSFWAEKFKQSVKGGISPLDFKLINSILVLCIIILAGYFLYNAYFSTTNLRNMPDLQLDSKESIKTAAFPEVSVLKKSSTYYLGKVRQRNIFRIGGADSVDLSKVFAPVIAARLVDEIKHLRLVGISWSDDPDAMVEDTNTGRTFFIKRGEMIDKFKVEAIFKDKIILGYGGEEVELK